MKILLLQDGGIHEKNKHLRECLTLQKGIRNIGHECDVWGKNHPDCDISKLPNFENYDLIVDLWEAYHDHLNLSSVKTKKLFWSCDAHVNGEENYLNIMNVGKYDGILKGSRDTFNNIDIPSFWLKPWVDSDFIKKKDVEKQHFMGFCGNRNPQRNEYIDRLTDMYNMKQDIFVIGDDMVNAINSYKISFNMNLGHPHGFSYRIAETLACGSLLLTNKSYMNDDVGLVNKKNCLIYDSFEDIVELIDWVKETDSLESIAEEGYKIHTQFLCEERAKDLVKIAESLYE